MIAPELWVAIEKAVCAGLGYSAAARQFNVSVFAIMQRSKRNNWPVGSRIQRRVEALHANRYKTLERYKANELARNGNEEIIEAVATNWSERGEMHRQLAFQIATSELKKVAHAPPPVESWRDVDFLDKIGRRSSGLDDSERNQNVNIGMQLIEYRLSQINLAPDAPEALQEPPKDK